LNKNSKLIREYEINKHNYVLSCSNIFKYYIYDKHIKKLKKHKSLYGKIIVDK
jgi:hypothetical protein